MRDSAPQRRGALTPSFAIVARISRRPPGGGGHGGPRSARQLLSGRRWSAGVPARSVRDSAPERGALTPSFAIVASIPRRPLGGGGHGGPRSARQLLKRTTLERGRPCPLGARQRAGARCSHSIVRDRREHSPPPSGRRRARRPALRQTIAFSGATLERGRPCPLGARQRAGARCSHSIVHDRREHSPPPSGRRRARRPALRQRRISRRRRGAAHATARRARIFICVIRGSPAARAARCAGLCLAQPLERRMADLAVRRPFGERDLGDESRLDPVGVAHRRAARRRGERARRPLERVELAAQRQRRLQGEARADLAGEAQRAAGVVGPDQQRPEPAARAARLGEADDDELLAHACTCSSATPDRARSDTADRARFETMPSAPTLQASASARGPSPPTCSA